MYWPFIIGLDDSEKSNYFFNKTPKLKSTFWRYKKNTCDRNNWNSLLLSNKYIKKNKNRLQYLHRRLIVLMMESSNQNTLIYASISKSPSLYRKCFSNKFLNNRKEISNVTNLFDSDFLYVRNTSFNAQSTI